jgi:hypothetical protein
LIETAGYGDNHCGTAKDKIPRVRTEPAPSTSQFSDRGMGSRIGIQRDHSRSTVPIHGLLKEAAGRAAITLCAQQEIVPVPVVVWASGTAKRLKINGGRDRTRTCDLLRVKQAL